MKRHDEVLLWDYASQQLSADEAKLLGTVPCQGQVALAVPVLATSAGLVPRVASGIKAASAIRVFSSCVKLHS